MCRITKYNCVSEFMFVSFIQRILRRYSWSPFTPLPSHLGRFFASALPRKTAISIYGFYTENFTLFTLARGLFEGDLFFLCSDVLCWCKTSSEVSVAARRRPPYLSYLFNCFCTPNCPLVNCMFSSTFHPSEFQYYFILFLSDSLNNSLRMFDAGKLHFQK